MEPNNPPPGASGEAVISVAPPTVEKDEASIGYIIHNLDNAKGLADAASLLLNNPETTSALHICANTHLIRTVESLRKIIDHIDFAIDEALGDADKLVEEDEA